MRLNCNSISRSLCFKNFNEVFGPVRKNQIHSCTFFKSKTVEVCFARHLYANTAKNLYRFYLQRRVFHSSLLQQKNNCQAKCENESDQNTWITNISTHTQSTEKIKTSGACKVARGEKKKRKEN